LPVSTGVFLFEVVELESTMRTYDKLIAAITARRAKGSLRSSPGVALARVSLLTACVALQES